MNTYHILLGNLSYFLYDSVQIPQTPKNFQIEVL